MVNCKHAASGCNYPEGECSGACLAGNTQRQPATLQYLTIVYQIHSTGQLKELLHATDWAAMSHDHAIHNRNALQEAELVDTQAQRLAAFRAIEKLNDELGKVSEQRDQLLAALKHIATMTNDGYAESHAREAIADAESAT